MTSPADRLDNGLSASTYVPLAEIDAAIGANLLDALRRARVPAYLQALTDERQRLYVAAEDRADARTIIQSAARAILGEAGAAAEQLEPDLLDGVDTEAEFAALTADWQVDTIAAVRAAERDLRKEDSDWRARLQVPADEDPVAADEHYVPPPPPPLPRLAPATVGALLVMILSIGVLVFGTLLGLPGDMTFLLGVGGLLVGAGMLVMRLRERPDEDDDDGAVL